MKLTGPNRSSIGAPAQSGPPPVASPPALREKLAEDRPFFTDAAYPVKSSLSVKLLAFYIFLIVSRVLDVSAIWFLHIPLILLIALTLLVILRGELAGLFSSSVARWFAAFTAWVLICFPLSTWRGGSVDSLVMALEAFLIFAIICQTVKSEPDLRKVTGAYAYAVLTASILSFFVGREIEGRLSLVNGSFADPNEFALILVVGLPFWWLKASRAGGFRKVLFLLCTVPVFVVFARTGSRSGLVALCALILIVLLFASVGQKLLIGLLAGVVVAAGIALLPDYLKIRFTTVFAPHTAEQLDDETRQRLDGDIGSSEGREMLLIQSVQMTFEHPVFGVGPGIFGPASWQERHDRSGAGGIQLVSHNTYTQISSETGLPGFILFIATLFLCVKYAFSDYRLARRVDSDLAKCGFYLFASLSALSVGIFFLSVGYTHTLAILFALVAALHKISRDSLAKTHTEAVEELPTPSWQAAKIQPQSSAPVGPKSSRPAPSANLSKKFRSRFRGQS